jgi:hypothetical protein
VGIGFPEKVNDPDLPGFALSFQTPAFIQVPDNGL